jgi:hypothetical protein
MIANAVTHLPDGSVRVLDLPVDFGQDVDWKYQTEVAVSSGISYVMASFSRSLERDGFKVILMGCPDPKVDDTGQYTTTVYFLCDTLKEGDAFLSWRF